MSLLEACQDVANSLSLVKPNTIIGNNNDFARQVLSHLKNVYKTAVGNFDWPQLTKAYEFDLVDGQSAYAAPADFDRIVAETEWDVDGRTRLRGGYNTKEWAALKYGALSGGTYSGYTLHGSGNIIQIDPTPDASGNTLAFYYISNRWIRPRTWTASTSFAAGSYCFYLGNYYSTTDGGTSGATAPTHTTGTASDDSINWTYYSGAYKNPLADTDEFVLDQQCVVAELIARYQRDKEGQHQTYFAEALNSWRTEFTKLQPKRTIYAGSRGGINTAGDITIEV